MEKILLAQLIAHIVADFFAQPECFSREKQNKHIKSYHIYVHALIVFVAALGMTFTCGFMWYALAIAIIHLGADILKCMIERKLKKNINDELFTNHYIFFADQVFHLIVIYGVVSMYNSKNGYIPACLDIFTTHQLLAMAGLLLCMKPSNILIRNCLSSLNLYGKEKSKEDRNDLERAGRWIGTIERIMAMALVMLQQYTAIGFIIAAKSVLRYNDSRTGKTEYVLIGTLLSFGIALFIGIGIKEGLFESFLNYISGNS